MVLYHKTYQVFLVINYVMIHETLEALSMYASCAELASKFMVLCFKDHFMYKENLDQSDTCQEMGINLKLRAQEKQLLNFKPVSANDVTNIKLSKKTFLVIGS